MGIDIDTNPHIENIDRETQMYRTNKEGNTNTNRYREVQVDALKTYTSTQINTDTKTDTNSIHRYR